MLQAIGKPSLDELFQSIPEAARFSGDLALEPSLGEPALMRHLRDLSRKNTGADLLSFLGAGMYCHHIPPAVDQLLLRSEFYTSYTPYQPEVAQGTLQAIWEYQTIVSELCGLPLSNASLYDGASATAEGSLMACRFPLSHCTKRSVQKLPLRGTPRRGSGISATSAQPCTAAAPDIRWCSTCSNPTARSGRRISPADPDFPANLPWRTRTTVCPGCIWCW